MLAGLLLLLVLQVALPRPEEQELPERHLQGQQQQELVPVAGWGFPLGTRLAFGSFLESFIFGSGAASQNSMALLAGYRYHMVTIEVTLEWTFTIDHAQAAVKLVTGDASPATCGRSAFDVSMEVVRTSQSLRSYGASELADGRLLRVSVLNADATQMGAQTTFPHVTFMHGGYYQLCYSPNGQFDASAELNTMVPVELRVIGVGTDCVGNGCLALERWDCFFSYRMEAGSICQVDFRSFGGGRPGWYVEAGTYSKSTWSALWGSDSYVQGEYLPGERRNCSDVVTAEYITPETGIFETFAWSPPLGMGFRTDTVTAMDMPKLKATRAITSYSLTVCYCPNYDGPVDSTGEPCDDVTEYIQPVGVVYYWLVRICDAGNTGSCGVVDPFMRILPQQPFSMRLQCPPGGSSCSGSSENRVKFLAGHCPLCALGDVEEQHPLWDPGSRCRAGKDESARLIFHPELFDESGVLIDPGLYRYGGARRDYKFWETPDLIAKLPMSERLTVCYCDTDCRNFQNYFEVGEVRMAESAGLARWSKVEEAFQLIQPIETVEYISKPGGLTLFGGIRSNLTEGMHPYDSVPWRRRSIMKVLSFDNVAEYTAATGLGRVTLEEYLNLNRESTPAGRRGLDFACAYNSTSAGTVNGPDSVESAKQYMAWVEPGPSQYLPFTGVENDQTFIFLQAGTYALCYCSFLDTQDNCDAETGYIWAAQFVVKGSRNNQNVILPTNFVVRIDLEGWGFTTEDTLRLITQTQTCYENANNPKGVVSGFRVGCPGIQGTSCRLPLVEEDIRVALASSERTGLYIESILIQETKSILQFSGEVTSEILDGDQITLDESSLLLNGRGQLAWTEPERYIISKLSGFHPFADEPQTGRMLWNRVSYVPGEPTKLSIALGWPEALRPEVSVLNARGGWQRRNRLETEEEIQADEEAQLKICWGARDGPDQEYYGEAGVLTFQNPAAMADAGLYFTSRVGGSIAPVVISFSPTQGKADYRRDTDIVLRILFKEIPRNIMPLKSNNLVEMTINETIPSENMSQAACGSLFLEMWTNDDGGFPLPNGCYFGPLYTNEGGEGASYREFFIQFKPSHPLKDQCSGDGRRQSCIYQLVMNMKVEEEEFQLSREILDLFTYCAGRSGYATICGPRYSVIEYGLVRPGVRIRAARANTTELKRVEMLNLQEAILAGPRGLGGELEPAQFADLPLDFGIRAWPSDGEFPIERQGRLQIIFQPLTVWRIDQQCNASCVPAPGLSCLDLRGRDMPCRVSTLADTTRSDVQLQLNVVELEYPDLMDEIPPERAEEAHLIALRNVTLPREGFFTTCTLAQYLDPEGLASMIYVTPCWKKAPRVGATTGQILVEGQAGNGPKPFAFELGNEIIVRLTLGTTLRNVPPVEAENGTVVEAEDVLMPAQVQVLLPNGYLCSVVGNGTADPLGEKSFFKQDLNNDGWNDNPMGTIFSGQWSSSLNVCTFSLEGTAALFANQFVDVRFSLQNPLEPMQKDDPANIWRIQLIASDGETLGGPANFLALSEEVPGWVGNLAVLGTLEGESIQPTNFVQGEDNYLNVFFQMTRNMPIWSQMVLDAPPFFDFTEACSVAHLEAEYYQDWENLAWGRDITGPRSTTSTLGEEVNCSVDDWQRRADLTAVAPYTRAILKIGRTLIRGKYYGFQIYIRNAEYWNLTQHDSWRLWLQSPDGYMVDGSKYTVQFNPKRIDSLPVAPHDRGWAVYPSGMMLPLNFSFGADRILPTSAFDMSAFLTIFPLRPSTDGQTTSLRLTAPSGYVWIPFAEQGWLGYVPNVTCKYCELIVTPQVKFQNELVLPDLVMRVNQEYGFRVRLWVPERPPSRSSNAFFLEMGFDPGGFNLDRMQAAMLPAPPLRVVHDAFIFSRCNLAGYSDNVLDFTLRIASPLMVHDGFLFAGDELTRGLRLRCWPEVLPGLLGITAANGACLVFEHPVSLLPMLNLYLTEGQLPAGHYGFRFREVTLPARPTSTRPSWLLGTFSELQAYPTQQILDLAVQAQMAQVLGLLPEAGILRPSFYEAPSYGRDDAPNRRNLLSFYFRVREPPIFPVSMETFVLALRGPLGYTFEEDCSEHLSAFSSGESRFPCSDGVATWCPGVLLSWPLLLKPVACLGIGSTARIDVPNSAFLTESRRSPAPKFQAGGLYGFEIQVTNPAAQPVDNVWALDFGSEASRPFQAIRIQTFLAEETILEMASTVASQFWWPNLQPYLPFRIDFRPDSTIPAPRMMERRLQSGSDPLLPTAEDGSLMVLAPPGFDFRKDDFDICVSSLLEVQGRAPWDFEAFFGGADVVCRVGDANGIPEREGGRPEGRSMVFLLINRKAVLQGQAYTLEGLVRNPMQATPASTWQLESFQRFIATGQRVRLDSYVLQGHAVTTPTRDFKVSNRAAEYYGGVVVHEVEFSMSFPNDLLTGQSIEIAAPPGFELRADAGSNASTCLSFRWLGSYRPLRDDSVGTCHCSDFGPSCVLVLNVSFVSSEPVLEAEDVMSFVLSLRNPETPRESLRNWWKITHWADGRRPLATGLAESWPVLGDLKNFSASIVGTRKRAGSESDLEVSFVTAAWGSTLELTIHAPLGFDFARVRPAAPYIREISSQGSRLVLVNGDFRPGILYAVFLGEVQLGQGGPTRISARLFSDFRMQSEVARRENMLDNFVQPGSITLISQELLSQAVVRHHAGLAYDSVLPLLPCFAQQLARIEIYFQLSRFVTAGSIFSLTNLGSGGNNHEFYLEDGFEPEILLCHGQDLGRNATSPLWQCDRLVKVNYTSPSYLRNNFDIVNGFQTRLARMSADLITDAAAVNEIAYLSDGKEFMALEANRKYRLHMWLIPTILQTQWYISTEHANGALTNTNDGENSAPTAVPQMSLSVVPRVTRAPPSAAVYVTVTIRAGVGQYPFTRLLLLLPFDFSPVGATPVGSGRPILELEVNTANPLEDEMSYQLRMTTPPRTNLDPRWFVLSRSLQVDEVTNEVSDQIVGWSVVDGFGVAPLPVTARYAALPSYTGWLSLTFKVPEIRKGRFALFTAPEDIQIGCPPSTQAVLPCENFQFEDGMPNAILSLPISRTLNLTLSFFTAEGQDLVYTAMLGIVTPQALRSLHPWELRIVDQTLMVVDSSLEIPSAPMQDLQAENPSIRWLSPAQRGEAARVAVQVIISRRIRTLRMLVFLMPEGYRHDIQHPNQLANINKNFPVAIDGDWRDFSNLRYVRVIVEPTTVASGTFEWQFPVLVAMEAPINTEWYVFMCTDYNCHVMSDPSVFVVFPVPDFAAKLPAKSFSGLMVTSGVRRLAAWSWLAWLVWLCM